MKKVILFVILFILSKSILSQSLSPVVSPSSGGYYTGGGNSLSWTLGETFTSTLSSGNNKLSQGFQQPEVDVKTSALANGPFCNGDTLVIPYTATGIIGTNNIFTAQLSDASGNFSSAADLGNSFGNTSGTIEGIIPFLTSSGAGYKVRVVASLPERASNSQGNYTVNVCKILLYFKAYIQGFYAGAGQMTPTLYNTGNSDNPNLCDSISVELHDILSLNTVAASSNAILHTDGLAEILFPASVIGGSYYIVIHHRNSIETWSKDPLTISSAVLSFDFSQ